MRVSAAGLLPPRPEPRWPHRSSPLARSGRNPHSRSVPAYREASLVAPGFLGRLLRRAASVSAAHLSVVEVWWLRADTGWGQRVLESAFPTIRMGCREADSMTAPSRNPFSPRKHASVRWLRAVRSGRHVKHGYLSIAAAGFHPRHTELHQAVIVPGCNAHCMDGHRQQDGADRVTDRPFLSDHGAVRSAEWYEDLHRHGRGPQEPD